MNALSRFMLVSGLVVIAFFVLQWINGRDQMADFRVYYDAASHFNQAESPYGEAFGVSSGYYKYAPGALLFFSPLALAPYKLASSLHFFLTGLIFLLLIRRLFHFSRQYYDTGKDGWALFFLGILVTDVMIRELHLGNINLMLLALLFAAFDLQSRGKKKASGLLTGLAIFLKPHFIVLIPWLILRKKWTELSFAGVALVLMFLAPVPIYGWSENIALHGDWIQWMQTHNVRLTESPNTIYGIVNHFILAPLGVEAGTWLVIVCLAAVGLIVLRLMAAHGINLTSVGNEFVEYALIIALVPNLTHTDTEHFLLSTPLLLIICAGLTGKIRHRRTVILLVLLACIPWLLNTPDIVGRKWAKIFDNSGLLGISNLVFLFIAFRLYYQIKVDRISAPS